MFNNYGYGYEPRADQPMGYPTPQVGYSWGLGYTQQPEQQQPQQDLTKPPSQVYGTDWNPSAYGYGSYDAPSQQQPPQPQRPSTGGGGGGGGGGAGASQYSEYQKYYYQSALQSTPPAAKPQPPKPSPSYGGYGALPTTSQSTANKWWASAGTGSTASSSSTSPAASSYSYNTSQYVTAAKNYYGRKQQDVAQPYSSYLDDYITQQRYAGGAVGARGGAESAFNGQKRVPIVRKPPVDQSKFFCDVCKIQCGSDQNFQAHLVGKSHKKKVSLTTSIQPAAPGTVHYRCEVCEVICTGKDNLEAHLQGAKHKKAVNMLHQLNKPIPSQIATQITTEQAEDGSIQERKEKAELQQGSKIKFVGGQHLSSTGEYISDTGVDGSKNVYPPGSEPPKVAKDPVEQLRDNPSLMEYKEPQPVGVELVEHVHNDPAAPHAAFKCTMCECFFNDDNAKMLHCKGRRHRLNYKKTYQPDLHVELSKQEQNKKARVVQAISEPGQQKGGPPRYVNGVPNFGSPEELRRQELEAKQQRKRKQERPHMLRYHFIPDGADDYSYWTASHDYKFDTVEDKLLLAKHNDVSWHGKDYDDMDAIVGEVEKALKLVSDNLLDEKMKERHEESTATAGAAPPPSGRDESARDVRGLMRVGNYASRTMVKGESAVELVLMCATKPTCQLLSKVATLLPERLAEINPKMVYTVNYDIDSACVFVSTLLTGEESNKEVVLKVVLTSIDMRAAPSKDAEKELGVLDREPCARALALQRHTKWFQNEMEGIVSFIILTRVLKGICCSKPEFAGLPPWVLELLIHRCAHSANPEFQRMGDIFKRVMECLSSGILLNGGVGVLDPCEHEAVDTCTVMTPQEREDVTAAAQHLVRLIAFDKLAAYLEVSIPVKLGGGDKAPSSSHGAKRPPPSDSAADKTPEEKRAKPQ